MVSPSLDIHPITNAIRPLLRLRILGESDGQTASRDQVSRKPRVLVKTIVRMSVVTESCE